jgi:hypothetical protein
MNVCVADFHGFSPLFEIRVRLVVKAFCCLVWERLNVGSL